jgi:hypothetical protein
MSFNPLLVPAWILSNGQLATDSNTTVESQDKINNIKNVHSTKTGDVLELKLYE